MRFAFIRRHTGEYPVALMCQVLGVSLSGYYAWLHRPESRRSRDDRRLLLEIRAIHRQSRRRDGSPRVHRELRGRGRVCGRHRVARLMRQDGLEGTFRRKFRVTTDSQHRWPVAANHLARRFSVSRPDRVWPDRHHLHPHAGRLAVSGGPAGSVLASNRGLGDESEADTLAAAGCPGDGRGPTPASNPIVHHSDRGSQYASADYRRALSEEGFVVSMSRRGDCYDNAPVESFFATLKRSWSQEKSSIPASRPDERLWITSKVSTTAGVGIRPWNTPAARLSSRSSL